MFIFDDISSYTNSTTNANKLCRNGSCKSIYKYKAKLCKVKFDFVLV